ncbi:MAG: hypothetical protein K2X86_08020 [Cytophagaceae bacterium]|nr:hypothetical protein [Cytophagaceae bacterium]
MLPARHDRFENLKGYASFLLEKKKLNELASKSILLAKQHNLVYVNYKSDKQLESFLTKSFKKFLTDITKDLAIDGSVETLNKWSRNEWLKTPKIKIYPSDISLGYLIRKRTLMDLMSYYTIDPTHRRKIEEELDMLLLIIEKTAISLHQSPR